MKELGYPQEGLWWWIQNKRTGDWNIHKYSNSDSWFVKIAAPTCAELGQRLSFGVWNTQKHNVSGWEGTLYDKEKVGYRKWHTNTEADCRASMLIYLLENKLMEVKDD